MKRIYFIFIIVIGALSACEKTNVPPPAPKTVHVENVPYIQIYYIGEPRLQVYTRIYNPGFQKVGIDILPHSYNDVILSDIAAEWKGHGTKAEPEKHRAIAERNGDMSFTGTLRKMPEAFNLNFNSMRITCDAAWDKDHPAGASLNDLSVITDVGCYFDYIESKYESRPMFYNKMLSDLIDTDFRIISPFFAWIDLPDDLLGREVTFTLTSQTADGETLTSSCTLLLQKDDAIQL